MKKFAKKYLKDFKNLTKRFPLDSFGTAARLMLDAYESGATIFVMGNGGSAATASHLACDFNKGVSHGLEKKFRIHCLNDNIPGMMAYANDYSFDKIFVEPLKNFLMPGDVVIGISSSGESKNVLEALRWAKKNGCATIGLTGDRGGTLTRIVDVSIIIPSRDTQKIEDMHLIATHMLMQILWQRLHKPKK